MNPYEQEARDKDPLLTQIFEIEARIKDVVYDTVDYGNIVRCSLTFDNGFRTFGVCERNGLSTDIAQTRAYADAIDRVRACFNFMKAERRMWLEDQARSLGMAAAFGTHGGD